MNWQDPLIKKFLYVIIAMIILCPLGILLVWNESAWGEWDPQEVAEKVGANKVSGMLHLADIWNHALLPDYDVPGWDDPFHASIGYIISAIVGVILCVSAYYVLVKIVNPKAATG